MCNKRPEVGARCRERGKDEERLFFHFSGIGLILIDKMRTTFPYVLLRSVCGFIDNFFIVLRFYV